MTFRPNLVTSFALSALFCLTCSAQQIETAPLAIPDHGFQIDRQQTELSKEAPKTSPLLELAKIESKFAKVIKRVQPSVVAVEGGSGVIVSETGLVLTVGHITKQAGRQLTVTLPDGRRVSAVTLGSNRSIDCGLIQLLGGYNWPHIEPTMATVKKGDWCLAFGYPLSFDRGVPSAVRIGRVGAVNEKTITTNCSIMGGDSGGPLFSSDGKLVGINSGVISGSNKNVHVPINRFLSRRDSMLAGIDTPRLRTSTKRKAYLGVLGETDVNRVRVRQVYTGSPAALAGFRPEDVIVKLNGEKVDSFSEVLSFLNGKNPGDLIDAHVNRYGNLIDLHVFLGAR